MTITGFSIIICCYNSQNRIIETLNSLSKLNQDSLLVEIIAIDNNSSDLTFEFLHKTLPEVGIPFKITRETLSGKANALITGFEMSKYDKMIVCDDDVLLDKDYLQVANSFFLKYPQTGILGGMGILKPEINLPPWFLKFQGAYAIGPQNELHHSVTSERICIWGAGAIVKKQAFYDIKKAGFVKFYTGIKEGYRTMSGEDSELCIWIKHVGYKLYYSAHIKYIHNLDTNRINWTHLLSLQIGFSRSQVYLYILEQILNCQKKEIFFDFNKYIIGELKFHSSELLRGFFTVNYFKSLWLAYVKKKDGYVKTIEYNDHYFKLKEYIQNRKVLKSVFDGLN